DQGRSMIRGTISKLPADRLLLEQDESRLEVARQGGGMIKSAGVQPESLRLVAPGPVDGPLQEPAAKTLADILRHQAELDHLDLIRSAAVQLGEAGGRALDVQDMQLIPGIAEDGGERLIRHLAATQPVVILAHGVVKRAVIRHAR